MLHPGKGQLTCCGEAMNLYVENTVDAVKEKHIPVMEKTDNGILVKVGSVSHPMEEKHYIEWVELVTGNAVYRKFFKPGEKPEALFEVTLGGCFARAYCNLHGLWKG